MLARYLHTGRRPAVRHRHAGDATHAAARRCCPKRESPSVCTAALSSQQNGTEGTEVFQTPASRAHAQPPATPVPPPLRHTCCRRWSHISTSQSRGAATFPCHGTVTVVVPDGGQHGAVWLEEKGSCLLERITVHCWRKGLTCGAGEAVPQADSEMKCFRSKWHPPPSEDEKQRELSGSPPSPALRVSAQCFPRAVSGDRPLTGPTRPIICNGTETMALTHFKRYVWPTYWHPEFGPVRRGGPYVCTLWNETRTIVSCPVSNGTPGQPTGQPTTDP